MSGDLHPPAGAARALRSTVAVRARARQLLGRARAGASEHFVVNDGAMALAASTVAELTRARYPGGRIPYHSRWRHFEAGGVDRKARLDTWLGPADAASLRAGDIVGEHMVQFTGLGERIELTHRATHRDIFARGALHVARSLVGRPPGAYRVRDLLD